MWINKRVMAACASFALLCACIAASVAHDSRLRIRQISKRGTEREIGLKKLYVVPLGFGMAVGRVREIHSSFSPTNIEAQRIVGRGSQPIRSASSTMVPFWAWTAALKRASLTPCMPLQFGLHWPQEGADVLYPILPLLQYAF